MVNNKGGAYIAVIALVLAVVAVAVVLKDGITGNAIFGSGSSSSAIVCKTFEVRQDQSINQCDRSYPKGISGLFLGGSPGNLMTVPLSCDTLNPREAFNGFWNDVYENEPITKVYASVTCCKK